MKGLLIIISGPSGAGKGTVLQHVLHKNPMIRCSISVTTREPRAGEVDGVNYFFRTVEEYKDMLHHGEFLEHQEVYGNLYATPKAYVEELRHEGYDVILEIDVKGALDVKSKIDDAILIFLLPKDSATLENRLIGRNTESGDVLDTRIKSAREEIARSREYEYVVINDDAERCADDIQNILRAERNKVTRNLDFIKSFR